jgi:uncharacterized delta-60 repeat protein
VDPFNFTTYETSLVFTEVIYDGKFTRDASGNFYGRKNDFKYYKFSPTGTGTFLAGDGNSDYGVFTPGLGAAARFGANGSVKHPVLDSSGNLFTVHEHTNRIIKIEPNGNVTSFAGTGTTGYTDGDAASATFTYPYGIAIDASNTLYVSDVGRTTIRKITPSGQVSTLTYSAAFSPTFYSIAVDSLGIVYGLELNLHRVYKITPTGPSTADIALLAGSTEGYADGQGSAARFNIHPHSGLCVDRFGNVYVGEFNNGSVRKITPSGLVSTIAGNGTNAASAGAETNTQLYQPGGVFVDTNGVVYVATATTIRKITPVVASLANAGSFDGFVVKYDSAGTPLWATRVSGTEDDLHYSSNTDSNGNIVVVGHYRSNPLTIYNADGTTFTTLAGAGFDGFVVKYNSAGTPQWARRMRGSGFNFLTSVSTDSNGNIVVAGYYDSNPLTINNADGTTFTTLTNSGSFDGFVVKYNSAGTPLWARRVGGTGSDRFHSVTTDSSGNIVVAGYYDSNPLTIYNADGTTFTTLTNSGSNDGFVVKYNPEGTPQWARRVGGTASDRFQSVTTDSSGNIVVAGYYASNPLTIYNADGTTFTTLAGVGDDGFVVKYASDGTPQWARRVGGGGTDNIFSVTTDSNGNIVVFGEYNSTPLNIYNADGTTFTTLTDSGTTNVFVVKYNSAGTPLWVRRVGGTTVDAAGSVSTDSNGNIVVIGYYGSNPLTIYNAAGTGVFQLTKVGNQTGFVVKYNSEGTPQWAKNLSINSTTTAKTLSVSTDSSGNIVVAGPYTSNPLTIT